MYALLLLLPRVGVGSACFAVAVVVVVVVEREFFRKVVRFAAAPAARLLIDFPRVVV